MWGDDEAKCNFASDRTGGLRPQVLQVVQGRCLRPAESGCVEVEPFAGQVKHSHASAMILLLSTLLHHDSSYPSLPLSLCHVPLASRIGLGRGILAHLPTRGLRPRGPGESTARGRPFPRRVRHMAMPGAISNPILLCCYQSHLPT